MLEDLEHIFYDIMIILLLEGSSNMV